MIWVTEKEIFRYLEVGIGVKCGIIRIIDKLRELG